MKQKIVTISERIHLQQMPLLLKLPTAEYCSTFYWNFSFLYFSVCLLSYLLCSVKVQNPKIWLWIYSFRFFFDWSSWKQPSIFVALGRIWCWIVKTPSFFFLLLSLCRITFAGRIYFVMAHDVFINSADCVFYDRAVINVWLHDVWSCDGLLSARADRQWRLREIKI